MGRGLVVASWGERKAANGDVMESTHDNDQEIEHDAKLGRAIVRGVLIGLPVVLISLTLGIWLITDNDLGDSIATALLPGILLGVFGGGFAGMASAMD
jgi:hypothetical protein